MTDEARIDKWLWASRIFKTRTIAADACKNGRVAVNDVNVKPSRMVKVGDKITLRKRSEEMEMFKSLREGTGTLTPKWLSFDAQNLAGTVAALPTREDIDLQVQENMIVEYYSR